MNLWILFFFCLLHGFAQITQLPLLNNFDHVSTNSGNKTLNNNQNTGSGIPEWPPAKVRIGYVVPSNRTPQANYKENLQFAIEMAQMWFRNHMQQNGFGPKTFIYETESDSPRPKIHLVNVPETDDYLRGNLFDRTKFAAKNAGLTIDLEGEIWVLIPETHVQKPDGSFIGVLALGGGGGNGNQPAVAELGSTVIQLFNPQRLIDNTNYGGQIIPELGPYPLVDGLSFVWFEGHTFSSVASSYLGALFHEMGHAFGINHDFRHDNNFFGGVMGNGLRGVRGSFFPALYPTDYTRLEFGSALMLNESYYFNRKRKATLSNPNVTVLTSGVVAPINGLLNIRFSALIPDSLSYAHLYNNNGELIDEMALNHYSVDTTFKTPYYNAGQSNSFYISVGSKQGKRTLSSKFTLTINAGNQAPKPFYKLLYPNAPYAGNNTLFDASSTSDPNGDSFTTEFDFNNDGVFDTPPVSPTYFYPIPQTGPYLSRIRVTDSKGASAISSPISGNYGKDCGVDAPTIIGVNEICPGSSVKLTAYGCYGTLLWSNGATTASITVNPTTSTVYTVTCNYGCGNQLSQPFTVDLVAENRTLSSAASPKDIQRAAQNISSTQEILPSSDVLYRASNSITLLPHFQTQNGSIFTAVIKGCNEPTAKPDNAFAPAGFPKVINVLSNDLHPNGTLITDLTQIDLPTIAVNPTKGTVTVNPNGTISYFSNENSGTDSFTYSVCNKNNPSSCATATVTVGLQMNDNPISNNGFENGIDFMNNADPVWKKGGWRPDQAVFSWLSGQGRNGSNCIKIYSGPASGIVQSNDVYAYQTIFLSPYTNYVLKGWVKTENVTTNANAGGVGACLSLIMSTNAFPPRSKDLKGTNDWTQLILPFNSGTSIIVTIACRLGFTAGDSEGTAYFDDLTIERLY